MVQGLFLKLTAKLAPAMPKDAFTPPEPEQHNELPAQTVARRLAQAAGRGPLTPEQKERGEYLVHLGFGSLWGAVYGLQRESLETMKRPAGIILYSTGVWAVSEHLLLPAFKLAAWPNRYPLKVHGYYWAAHLLYGASVAASYHLLRRSSIVPALVSGWLLITRGRLRRRLPGVFRPAIGAAFDAVRPAVQAAARLKNSAVRL